MHNHKKNEKSFTNSLTEAFGISLNTEIKLITHCFVKSRQKVDSQIKTQFEKLFLCLAEEEIIFFDKTFNKIIFTLKYHIISDLVLDKRNYFSFLIYLKNFELSGRKVENIYLTVSDRENFLQTLKCYYSICYADKFCQIKDLPISEASIDEHYKKFDKFKIIKHNPPESFRVFHYNNYNLFVHEDFKFSEQEFCFDFYIESDFKLLDCKLYIDFDLEMNISLLSSGKLADIGFNTYEKMRNIMSAINNPRYVILKDSFYIKKYNFNDDESTWVGWQLEILMTQPIKKKIILFTVRRKYIPPFFETFSDFTFRCEINLNHMNDKELVNFKNTFCQPLYFKLETMIDSLSSEFVPSYHEYYPLLNLKYESLSLEHEALLYFDHVLDIRGEKTHQEAVKMIYILISQIEKGKFVKNCLAAYEKFEEKLGELFLHQLKNFKFFVENFKNKHKEILSDLDFSENENLVDTFKNFNKLIRPFFESIDRNKTDEVHENNKSNLFILS
jgi:hypothetical protein